MNRTPTEIREGTDPEVIETAIARAQALANEFSRGTQDSIVDEFIAERRADALKEDGELNPEAHKAARSPE